MSNPWSINKCENCLQDYCMECSEALDPLKFCSKLCEGVNRKIQILMAARGVVS